MKHASIEIIQKCPNKCIHCSSIAGPECNIQLGSDILKQMITQLAEMGCENISISGGEPFLYGELAEIVKFIHSRGVVVDIYTSGIMIEDKDKACSIPDNLINKLKEYGVNKLIFNLQSVKENTYDEIMGTSGNLKLVIESISRSKKNNIYTEIHFVPMKINFHEVEDVIRFVEKYNLDRVSFLGLIPHGRAKDNKDKLYLSVKETKALKTKLKEIESEHIRIGVPLQIGNTKYKCTAAKDKIFIKFDGTVYGCEAFKYVTLYDEANNMIEPDSVYDKSISEIYNNSRHLKEEKKFINEQHIRKDIKRFENEEKCPVQRFLRLNE